jgi:ATP-binding cassette, subfamily B, bacterial MsbA
VKASTGDLVEPRFLVMLAIVLLMIILKSVANYSALLASNRLVQVLTRKIRKEGIRVLLDVDLDFFHKNRMGDISNILGIETDRTAVAIKTATNILITTVAILVFVSFLLAISWQLTIIATVLLALSTLSNQFFVRTARRIGQQYSDAASQYSVAEFEVLSGMRLIKATAQEAVEYQRLSQLIQAKERAGFPDSEDQGAPSNGHRGSA